jgi:tellurite resistance protein
VTFSNGTDLFRDQLEEAIARNRQAARKFLEAVIADGGTEIAAASNALSSSWDRRRQSLVGSNPATS